jgi:hypothetical protein
VLVRTSSVKNLPDFIDFLSGNFKETLSGEMDGEKHHVYLSLCDSLCGILLHETFIPSYYVIVLQSLKCPCDVAGPNGWGWCLILFLNVSIIQSVTERIADNLGGGSMDYSE